MPLQAVQAMERLFSSRQPPPNNSYRKLIIPVIQKTDMNAAIRIRRHDPGRRALSQLPAFWQYYHIALNAQWPHENQLPVRHRVRIGVSVGLKYADARLAALRHRSRQVHFDELGFVWSCCRYQAGWLGIFAVYHLKLQLLAGAAC